MTSDFTSSYDPDDEKRSKRDFICGVIEGFYGRPWTTEQRKDLFRKYGLPFIVLRLIADVTHKKKTVENQYLYLFVYSDRMKRWGIDSYVYAPKDDYKHRAYWRELYTVEEADHLSSNMPAEHDLNFLNFGIPGLSADRPQETFKEKKNNIRTTNEPNFCCYRCRSDRSSERTQYYFLLCSVARLGYDIQQCKRSVNAQTQIGSSVTIRMRSIRTAIR